MSKRRYPRTVFEATPALSEVAEADRSFLEDMITKIIEGHGLWAEEVGIDSSGGAVRLQVVLDQATGTEGLSLDTLSVVSQDISEALDVHDDDIPQLRSVAYELEVSTPGTNRPLVRPYQWKRNLGRVVDTNVVDHQPDGTWQAKQTFTARIDAVDETGVELAKIVPGAKKGMPDKELAPEHFSFEELADSIVQVELRGEK